MFFCWKACNKLPEVYAGHVFLTQVLVVQSYKTLIYHRKQPDVQHNSLPDGECTLLCIFVLLSHTHVENLKRL